MEGLSDEADKEHALLDLASLYSSVSSCSSVTANTLRDEVLHLSDPSVPGLPLSDSPHLRRQRYFPSSELIIYLAYLSSLSNISNKGSEEVDLSEETVVTDEAVEVKAGVN